MDKKDKDLLNQTFEPNADKIAQQINDVKELLDGSVVEMSDYDYELVENLVIQHEEGKVLSEKQINQLDRVWILHCTE
jgi:hypothetical protein